MTTKSYFGALIQRFTRNPKSSLLLLLRRYCPALGLALVSACALSAQTSVTTQHNDISRTGANTNETILTPANVNVTTFGRLFSQTADGYVYAQPLYLPSITMGPGTRQAGTTHNVLFVATQHDSVYAWDADSNGGANALPLWQITLLDAAHGAAAGATTVPSTDVGTSDVVPELGITGTPVIDPTTNTLYVVGKTKESGVYFERIHALDITTGQEKFGGPVAISGSVTGNGNGSSGGVLKYDPKWQHQRSGLLLLNGILYIAFGSHGDNGPWHGWIFGYKASTLAQTGVWCTSPNSFGSGVWMGGTGLAADIPAGKPYGRIFTTTGNGLFDASPPYNNSMDFGDSILTLDLTNGMPSLVDVFAPHDQSNLDTADEDQASGGVVVLPDSVGGGSGNHQLVQLGKSGRVYVLNRENLGGYNPNNSTDPQQKASTGGLWGGPAYWNGAVYIWGLNDVLKAFAFANGTISSATPISKGSIEAFTYSPSPSISANGVTNGIVWSMKTDNFNTGGNATLYANDATNVATVLYSSDQNTQGNDVPGQSVKFVTPTIVNGKVYVGTATQVSVYGLLASSPQAAIPMISPVGQSFTGSLQVTITDSTSSATIYYTTDGSVPNGQSQVYSAPITVNTTQTVSAVAGASGYLQSSVASQSYTLQNQTLAPVFSPLPTIYSSPQTVTITDGTPSAVIYFTTDGTTPSPGVGSTQVYNVPPTIGATATLKAIAVSGTLGTSPVSSGLYTIVSPGTTVDFSVGFSSAPATMTFNGSTGLDDTRLQLTSGVANQAGTAFYNTPLNIQSFTTDFSFQLSNAGADGITFTIQSNSPTALGPSGGGLGYGPDAPGGTGGIPNSVAIKFDTYSNQGESPNSTGLYLNGASPTIPAIDLTSSGIDLHSGSNFSVHLAYDGTNLSMTLSDPVSGHTFTTTWQVNIPAAVGGPSAFVGFTGGTGGLTSSQKITTWTFSVLSSGSVSFSSANNTSFTVGSAGSFIVTTTGTPTPALTESGALPSGVTFRDNGNGTATLSGTPASGSSGTYALGLTASNGVGSPASQAFTLAVASAQVAPAITSANNATFAVGTAGNFTVTTTGSPTPALTRTGTLPTGVSFVDNGSGTGTLSGTPASGSSGSYTLTITANNGVGTAATQTFTLTVNGGGGGGGSFTYVNGSVTGVIDSSSNSTKTLAVALHQNPGAGHLLICAATWQSPTATATMSDPNNGTWMAIGSPKTGVGTLSGYRGQMFYVPSAVNASTTVTLTISSNVAFRGFECAEYSYAGTLASLDGTPQYSATAASGGVATVSGVTTVNSSDLLFADCLGVDSSCSVGTGYSALNDSATYDVKTKAYSANFGNWTGQIIEYKVGAAAGAQSATFTVGATDNVILGLVGLTANAVQTAPTITSVNSATFTVGTAGNFTLTTSGSPVPALSEAGALPGGVTFKDNGNGTGTLSGTPASGSGGSYALTLTASNGVGTAATQSFTLTINTAQVAPSITSASATTFTVGTAGSFTATTTGSPAPSLTETGALPTGVTFVDNGNGTAKLSGTPASGSGGSYTLTLTANNGVGTAATQSFTLKVNQAPAITSASTTTFTVGTAGSFTATTTGSPAPSLTETGALPTGVTFVDNGNGTAKLSGTPGSGSGGSYTLTLTANNGVGTAATQSFTLKVNQAPAITSASTTTFTVGTAGSFTATATGSPTPSLTRTGVLPTGVTFVDNGNGTGTLSGTPASGSGGS